MSTNILFININILREREREKEKESRDLIVYYYGNIMIGNGKYMLQAL